MMNVKVSELLKGLKNVKPALNKKSVLLMATQDKRLMLQANDGACAASSVVLLEEDTVSSVAYVNFMAFSNALSAVSRIVGDEAVVIIEISNALNITCNATSISVPLLAEADYSVIGEVGEVKGQVTLNGHLFRKALNSAIMYGGQRVYLTFKKDSFGSAGTDSVASGLLNNLPYVQKPNNTVPIPEKEEQLVVVLSLARAKGLASVIDEDSDLSVYFYEHYFACLHGGGESLISVPIMTGTEAKLTWLKAICSLVVEASEGSTYEINRKELLNSLELLACNQDTKAGMAFSFSYAEGSLVLQNLQNSAQTQIGYSSSDGAFEGRLFFNTPRVKEIASSLEGEELLMTLAFRNSPDGTPNGGYTLHFEEGTKQIVLFGYIPNLAEKNTSENEEQKEQEKPVEEV